MQAMRNHITNLKAEIRSEVQATLQNQINSLKGEFKNELKNQHNLFVNQQNDFQNNLQNMLSGFFQNQSQPSTSTSMVPTTLPSNTITNPRGEVRAITTRSGLSYTPVPPIPPPLYDENEPLIEKETEVTKDKVLPSTKNIQPPVIQKSHDPVKPVSSPISPEPSSAQVDNSSSSKESSKETRLPYLYESKLKRKDSNDKVQIQKFWEMFKKIHVDITLADALILMPKYQKMLKSLLTNKDKLIEIAKTPMNANCSAVILKKSSESLVPGSISHSLWFEGSLIITLALRDDFQSFKTFSNPLFEKQDDFPSRNDESILKEETFKSYLNPLFEKDEEIISNEASSIISPKIDVTNINDSENVLGIHDNEEEEIAFLDGLLEDENFFEMNDKKVESFESKTKEDFETKVEPEKKKELQVFHPDIEILDHLETTSYVGSDYVFYEDFNLVDMIFPMNIQGKIFDPGITFHGKSFEKDVFNDKSSKELAPSKALLTLDVFDPPHPPLMNFNVTKAFSEFTFSILKIFSKKFVEPGIKNVLFFTGYMDASWFQYVWKDKGNSTIAIDVLILLFKNEKTTNHYLWFFIELNSILLA
ncbi:hypothetical protein Tco_0867456 [Tanacetum coccineum]